MRDVTLRKQFMLALIIVFTVSIMLLWGNRIVGKGALFHYLERNHLELVLRIDATLTLVEQGAKNKDTLRREDLIKYIDDAILIADHANYEVFYVEEVAFRLFGFGDVFDIARKDIEDLNRAKAKILAAPGSGVPLELAIALRPEMLLISDAAARYGPAVEKAVTFAKNLAVVLTIFGLSLVGLTLWLLRRSVLGPINEALTFAKRIASSDLSGAIKVTSHDEFGELLHALNEMNANLAQIVGEVRDSTHVISDAAKDVAAGNADLSSRTESQSGSIRDTSSLMAGLTATVKKNAESASEANRLVLSTADVAAKGSTVVSQVVSTMGHISASSNKINDIISVIDGIAFQTNILALNAAVEAARAGEQGRGFAVVAAEVRSLAQRSASAAKEIKQLISGSAEWVQTGSRLVQEAGQTMEEIGISVKQVTDIMGEISQASLAQNEGIADINQALTTMDNITGQNVALVEHAAATARSLEDQASVLKHAVSVFTLR